MGRTRNAFTFKKRQKELEKKRKKEEKIKHKTDKPKPLIEDAHEIEENSVDMPSPGLES